MGVKTYYLLHHDEGNLLGIKGYYYLVDRYKSRRASGRCLAFDFEKIKGGWRKKIGPLYKHLVASGVSNTSLQQIKVSNPKKDPSGNLQLFIKPKKPKFKIKMPTFTLAGLEAQAAPRPPMPRTLETLARASRLRPRRAASAR